MTKQPGSKIDQLTPIILSIAGSALLVPFGLFACFVGAFGVSNFHDDHPHASWWLSKLADISYASIPLTGLLGIILCFYVCVGKRRMRGLAWLALPIPFVMLFFAVFGQNVSTV